MKTLSALICVLLPFTSAYGYVETIEPVSISTDMSVWVADFDRRSETEIETLGIRPDQEAYTECFETREIAGAFICASRHQVNMNRALARASFFVEGIGSNAAGTVPDTNSLDVQTYLRLIGGHDLRSEDLLAFWREVQAQCEITAKKCASEYEKDFFENFVLPTAQEYDEFVVITYAAVSSMGWNEVVTHEVMHAQYFLDDGFREVAQTFWQNQVPEEDKENVRLILSRHYDATNEELMINEFQAYILMAGAEQNMLAGMVKEFRDPLMKEMERAGIKPIQVR